MVLSKRFITSFNYLWRFSKDQIRVSSGKVSLQEVNGSSANTGKQDMVEAHPEGLRISADVSLGRGVKLFGFVNLYGCEIGDESRIGCFVEIQRGAKIGARCKISSHSFICDGVIIEDEVFIGHGVMFTNDRQPRAVAADGSIIGAGDWKCQHTLVKKGASIGSGSTILSGLTIGERAMVGAGSVVTTDIPSGATAAGNPARVIKNPDRP
jgi:UDP-2-acetamido-3-amino-2,3-dideoxy-glucuronate N-acetyltransferase